MRATLTPDSLLDVCSRPDVAAWMRLHGATLADMATLAMSPHPGDEAVKRLTSDLERQVLRAQRMAVDTVVTDLDGNFIRYEEGTDPRYANRATTTSKRGRVEGRARQHATNADRQKAYRARKAAEKRAETARKAMGSIHI